MNQDASDNWVGNGPLRGGKGYVTTPLGQIHYRDVGSKHAPVTFLLLHQTWLSIIQFADAQNELVAMGYRAIALDMPGHGLSDPPLHQPTIAEIATNVSFVLDALAVGKVVVVGHHSGAAIAAKLAAHYPGQVRAAILHGSPLFTAEEIALFRALPDYDRTPRADGGHMSQWFARTFAGDPQPSDAGTLLGRTWMLISKFSMGPDIARAAVFENDMVPDIQAIAVPTLILTDGADPIRHSDLRVRELRADFAYEVFSEEAGMSVMAHPRAWAEKLVAFATSAAPASPEKV